MYFSLKANYQRLEMPKIKGSFVVCTYSTAMPKIIYKIYKQVYKGFLTWQAKAWETKVLFSRTNFLCKVDNRMSSVTYSRISASKWSLKLCGPISALAKEVAGFLWARAKPVKRLYNDFHSVSIINSLVP